MRPNITITIPTPYLPLDEYCRITGIAMGTARDMIRDGRLPIRGKGDKPRARVEVNMAALTVEALSECRISLQA
ncbi:regulator [Pantoea agglomerans]|uniref:Regulator n=1 Tax=Enterobacter agglomerans TaxID=549 RepID=A0ACC5RL23_ENTAG|nr:regulator [Pantoea agglomerans]MBK4725053.1 regulator [Pantoea agglomerans]